MSTEASPFKTTGSSPNPAWVAGHKVPAMVARPSVDHWGDPRICPLSQWHLMCLACNSPPVHEVGAWRTGQDRPLFLHPRASQYVLGSVGFIDTQKWQLGVCVVLRPWFQVCCYSRAVVLYAETTVVSNYWLDFRQLRSESAFPQGNHPALPPPAHGHSDCDPHGCPCRPGRPTVGHCKASVSPDGTFIFWLEELFGGIDWAPFWA